MTTWQTRSHDPRILHDGRNILRATRATHELFGVDPDRLQGRQFWGFVPRSERARLSQSFDGLSNRPVGTRSETCLRLRSSAGAPVLVVAATQQRKSPYLLTTLRREDLMEQVQRVGVLVKRAITAADDQRYRDAIVALHEAVYLTEDREELLRLASAINRFTKLAGVETGTGTHSD